MASKKPLTKEDVKHVGNLIKIHLPEEELELYGKQLNSVLDSLEVFDELDTEQVPITAQVTGLVNVMAEDVVDPSLTQEEALQNAPQNEKGFFVISKVFHDE